MPAQGVTNQFDHVVAERGEVGDGFLFDLAIFAVRATEQMGAIGLAFVAARRGDHVRLDRFALHGHIMP